MIQWRKIISLDFHPIPKLSIGFKHIFVHNIWDHLHNYFNITHRNTHQYHNLKKKVLWNQVGIIWDSNHLLITLDGVLDPETEKDNMF